MFHTKNFYFEFFCAQSYNITTLQTILEKFEFFPIKCRVQRSMDVFTIAQEHRNEAIYKPFRLKVKSSDLLHRMLLTLAITLIPDTLTRVHY
jgi:hypothetical protein